jgi:hypothetical protein
VRRACDLQVEWSLLDQDIARPRRRPRRVIGLRDGLDNPVATITKAYGESDIPTGDADRLAILMVNEINASRQVADWKHLKAAPVAADPIVMAEAGISIGYDASGKATLEVLALQSALAHVPADKPVDGSNARRDGKR